MKKTTKKRLTKKEKQDIKFFGKIITSKDYEDYKNRC